MCDDECLCDDGSAILMLEQEGGRISATTWPVQPGQVIDVFFDGKQGAYESGYYRGIVDEATAPNAKGTQKLEVDFLDDLTSTKIDLNKDQLYEPGTQPKNPTVEQGEIAVIVSDKDLPVATTTPYGLSETQQRVIKDLYYEQGHYAGRDRMWALLKAKAKDDGKLESKTVTRKGKKVVLETPYGIRYNQLQSYLNGMEHRQLFRVPERVKVTRSFILPIAPARNFMMDTLDLGAWGGGPAKTQRYIISIIDPSSKWVYAEIFAATAPKKEDAIKVFVTAMQLLRDGPLQYKARNKENVFDSNGTLLHSVRAANDRGLEFGSGKSSFADELTDRLLDDKLIASNDKFTQRFNLASAPTQAAHIERWNRTLRTKLKLAVHAELGGISRKKAVDARKQIYTRKEETDGLGAFGQSKNPKGWTALVARAVKANNEEVTAGTTLYPNDYMEMFVAKGKDAVKQATKKGDTAQDTEKGEDELEKQMELTVGTLVRRKDLAKSKAELKGFKKMLPNWSEEIFRVTKVTTQKQKGIGKSASYLYQIARTNGDKIDGSYRREELLIVPNMEDVWHGPRKGRDFTDKLRQANTIPKWDTASNRPKRDGSSWAEKEIAKIPKQEYVGLRTEQILRRLIEYLSQGMSKKDALERLQRSIHMGAANTVSTLAALKKDD